MSDSYDFNDFNRQIIEEFRANAGVVGGPFEGAPMLILHTTGAKSGLPRETPLVFQAVGDGYAIFGSKGGATTAPDWYHNLVANPAASIEVGSETFDVTVRILEGAEREEVWERQKALMSNFAEYEKTANRTIPVVVLSRA